MQSLQEIINQQAAKLNSMHASQFTNIEILLKSAWISLATLAVKERMASPKREVVLKTLASGFFSDPSHIENSRVRLKKLKTGSSEQGYQFVGMNP